MRWPCPPTYLPDIIRSQGLRLVCHGLPLRVASASDVQGEERRFQFIQRGQYIEHHEPCKYHKHNQYYLGEGLLDRRQGLAPIVAGSANRSDATNGRLSYDLLAFFSPRGEDAGYPFPEGEGLNLYGPLQTLAAVLTPFLNTAAGHCRHRPTPRSYHPPPRGKGLYGTAQVRTHGC
jgi:hypothetical protein